MTLKEYSVEEQAQLYNLTEAQNNKLAEICEKHHIYPIRNFRVIEVNRYGTQFAYIEELPYISVSSDLSPRVTVQYIGEGDYIKNTHDLEVGTIEFIGVYYKFTYVHRQNEDNNFVLTDSHNTSYCFRTLSSLMTVVRSLAVAESIGLVVTSAHPNDMRYYIDGNTPKEE